MKPLHERLRPHLRPAALLRALGWFLYLVVCMAFLKTYADRQWGHSTHFAREVIEHLRE